MQTVPIGPLASPAASATRAMLRKRILPAYSCALAGTLRKAGCKSRRKVRADIEAGALHPYISIRDYGRYADREVRKWLGLKSWTECWGDSPRIIRRKN